MRIGLNASTGIGVVLLCAACAAVPPGGGSTGAGSPEAVADEILAADRTFSAASARTDLVSGVSAMFAPDVAMSVPGGKMSAGATEAIEALRANADNARSRAEWAPVRVGVSADGTQGYTWGYMTVTKSDGTALPFKYLSYWVKGSNGWRVVAYRRRPRPPGEISLAMVAPSLPAASVAVSTDSATTERYRASLDRTERAFSDEAKVVGLGVAFARFGRADAVNMGTANDVGFVVGSEAIGRAVSGGNPTELSTLAWAPDRTLVATSGDMGVTIGRIRDLAPATDPNAPTVFPFFTVWQRANVNDPWRYVAE